MKLAIDFITWRWSPAVGLLTASMAYVLVVVGLIPSEIGTPVPNAKLGPSTQGASGSLFGGTQANVETNEGTYAPTNAETRPVSTPPRPVVRAPVADFGRRGFSPPISRPEPPSTPAPPAAPAPTPIARSGFAGIFSRIQGALRPGSPAAQSLAEARQAQIASAQPAPPAPSPPGAPPGAQQAPPAPPAPADAAQQQPPDAQPQPAAPAESGAAPAPPGEAPAPEAPAQ